MTEEKYYSFEEALCLTELQPARFRFLEKEFGSLLGIKKTWFGPSVYSSRQISILRKIESVLQQNFYNTESVKEKIRKFIATRENGIWITAVTSGKGGVGKTTVSVNLSVALSRLGVQPTIVDADLGLANAHLLLGLFPRNNIYDLLKGKANIEDILVKTDYGIILLPGGSGVSELANLDDERREALADEVQKLYYHTDTMIIDTGSGISTNVMRFLHLADEIIVVVTPNIASCIDALGIIQAAEEEGCEGRINVLVNRCRDEQEGREVFCKLNRSVHNLTGRSPWYMGFVPEDRHLEESFQKGVPVNSYCPSCRAARQIRHIARAILGDKRSRPAKDENRIIRLFGGLAGVSSKMREV